MDLSGPAPDHPPSLDAAPSAAPFPLRAIVAACDLSPAGENAAWRAALLAREHGAALRLLCVRARRSQLPTAQSRLDALAADLRERMQVAVTADAVAGSLPRELAAAAAGADLFVLRAGSAHPLADWLAGSHPGRLLRHLERPVLVVRKPAAVGYRRVLASVAFDGRAAAVIAAATGMMRGPHGEVLEALAAQPDLARPGNGGRDGLLAARRLRTVVQEVMAREDGARRVVEAPVVVLDHTPDLLLHKERVTFADLLVLARRPADEDDGWLMHGDAQRVLARAASDVLLLPADAATSAPALQR
jgi:nucleotide-binding universal stress UspA family protein